MGCKTPDDCVAVYYPKGRCGKCDPKGYASLPEERRLGFPPQAKKDRTGKTIWSLLSFPVLRGMAEVMAAGLYRGTDQEREPDDWKKGADWSLYHDALLRHVTAWWEGEDKDKTTGKHHLLHAMCCCMILVWWSWHRRGTDDRPTEP